MTTFHHSPIDSDRIQRLLRALRAAGEHGLTTMELNRACSSTRASSDVSEARACGVNIECIYDGETEAGRRVFRYRLVEKQMVML